VGRNSRVPKGGFLSGKVLANLFEVRTLLGILLRPGSCFSGTPALPVILSRKASSRYTQLVSLCIGILTSFPFLSTPVGVAACKLPSANPGPLINQSIFFLCWSVVLLLFLTFPYSTQSSVFRALLKSFFFSTFLMLNLGTSDDSFHPNWKDLGRHIM